jgi:hypothetical protein
MQKRLNHPNFAIAERREDLERQISNLIPPLMFKPVDTSPGNCRSRQNLHRYRIYERPLDFDVRVANVHVFEHFLTIVL